MWSTTTILVLELDPGAGTSHLAICQVTSWSKFQKVCSVTHPLDALDICNGPHTLLPMAVCPPSWHAMSRKVTPCSAQKFHGQMTLASRAHVCRHLRYPVWRLQLAEHFQHLGPLSYGSISDHYLVSLLGWLILLSYWNWLASQRKHSSSNFGGSSGSCFVIVFSS